MLLNKGLTNSITDSVRSSFVQSACSVPIVSFPQGFFWKGARNFGKIVRQLWGVKKQTNDSKSAFYDEYTFYTIVGFFNSYRIVFILAGVHSYGNFSSNQVVYMQARLILASWSCDTRNLVLRVRNVDNCSQKKRRAILRKSFHLFNDQIFLLE